MQIDRGELKKASRAFSDADIDLTDQVNALLKLVAAPSEICGHDEAGKQALTAFTKAQHDIGTYVSALATAYGEIAGGLTRMADNTDVAEWNIKATLPEIP